MINRFIHPRNLLNLWNFQSPSRQKEEGRKAERIQLFEVDCTLSEHYKMIIEDGN